MPFKFEKLDVWKVGLDYLDVIYDIGDLLPASEMYNLRSQITRAATSVTLAVAEGSTGQTNAEQSRFLGIASRSVVETVACLHIIHRRKFVVEKDILRRAYDEAERLFAMLCALRTSLDPDQKWVREEAATYDAGEVWTHPFA